MSLFIPTIPNAGDNLDFSQGQLKSNNSGLDTVFGIDHYKFSDVTSNKGFHNTVTQPLIVGSAHPTTTANPIIYAMQDSANVGVIQYSRGPSSAPPTPVTYLQSTVAPISISSLGTTNVLDFTGIARAYGVLYFMDTSNISTTHGFCYVFWTGSSISTSNLISTTGIVTQVSGNILQLLNSSGSTLSNVYWTLQFTRLS